MTRPSRPRRASAAILGCWLALLGLAAGVLPASAAPTPPSGEVSFDLTEVSPAVARPSDTLTITGTVTNSTDEAFTNPQVRIGVQRAVPDDVEELMAWFDQDDPPSARLEYQGDQRLTVEPGQSAEVTLTVPVEQIPFPIRFDNWGARGLEISLITEDAVASVRTMGVFYPEEDPELEPVEVAAVIPATPTAEEWEAGLGTDTLVGAEVSERIRDLTAIPGASIALDPVMVDASAALEVIALPWADADVGMLASAGREGSDLLTQARERALGAFDASPVTAQTDVAWPLAQGVTRSVLTTLQRDGYQGVILEADAVAPSDEPTPARVDIRLTPSSDTPESNDDARETGEVMPAIVADATFTEVLLAQVPHDSVAPDLAARQLALAYSAVVARQDGGATPVAAVADRESAAELTTSETLALGDRLTALSQAPWVELVDAAEMLDGEASAQVGLSSQDSPTYPAAQLVVTETLRLDAVVAGLASAFDSDAEFLALRSSLTIAPSAAWRDAGTNGSLVTQRVSARVEELSDAIVVSPPESNVNLFAEESAIPVVVTNTLDVPVTVRVQLIPEHPALRIEGAPDVRLEAGAAQTVRIPVTALANGTTTVDVVVASPDGVRLGPPSTFQMTVRAEWESVTTGVLAAALGVLLVIGLVRNIRRGRRGDDGLPPPAAPDRVKERAS